MPNDPLHEDDYRKIIVETGLAWFFYKRFEYDPNVGAPSFDTILVAYHQCLRDEFDIHGTFKYTKVPDSADNAMTVKFKVKDCDGSRLTMMRLVMSLDGY